MDALAVGDFFRSARIERRPNGTGKGRGRLRSRQLDGSLSREVESGAVLRHAPRPAARDRSMSSSGLPVRRGARAAAAPVSTQGCESFDR